MQAGIYKIQNLWFQALDNDLKIEKINEKLSSKSLKFNKAYHDLNSRFILSWHESSKINFRGQFFLKENKKVQLKIISS